jgi:hypothetical protein
VRRVEAGESIVHNARDLDEEVDGKQTRKRSKRSRR